MENINKISCCLFKSNPNINPITNQPLTKEEKIEWMNKCKDYMSKLKDESIEDLKNTDIFSPRVSSLISLSEIQSPKRPMKPPKYVKKPSESSEDEIEIIEVSKPIYPPVELRKTIIPATESETASSSIAPLNEYYIKINSNLIFEDSILDALRIDDLKNILKNEFINISAPNIIKSFNTSLNNNITFSKILLNKVNMIQFIKFLKDVEYKNNIKPNVNDYIYNILVSNKIKLSQNGKVLIDQYLQKKKKPIVVEQPTLPDEFSDFTKENIMNSFDLLIKRAAIVNSDNFLYELNIKSINNELYKKKYDEQNFIFVFKLFWKDSSIDVQKPSSMPNTVYDLIYVNKNIEDYKKISLSFLEKNKKLDLNNFIELCLNYLNFIKTRPFNKYIPFNLNKYIKKQEGAVAIEPQQISNLPGPSKIKPRDSSTKERRRPKSPEIEIIEKRRPKSPEIEIIKESIPKSSKQISTNRSKSVQKYETPELQESQKFFYPSKRGSSSSKQFTRLPEKEQELYTPVSPKRISPIEPYRLISPVYSSTQPTTSSPPYRPVSPTYAPTSPPYRPVSPVYASNEYSPPYQPTNEPISTSPLEQQSSSRLFGLPPVRK